MSKSRKRAKRDNSKDPLLRKNIQPPTKRKRGRKRKNPVAKKHVSKRKKKVKREVKREVEGSLAWLIRDRRRSNWAKLADKEEDEKKKEEEKKGEDEEKKQLDKELEDGQPNISPLNTTTEMDDPEADDPFPGDQEGGEVAEGEGFFCANCKKRFNDQNVLAIHEKIPHFWACKETGCGMSFETKDERAEHIAKEHDAVEAGSSSTGIDHLLMNADGTMCFNRNVSKNVRKGGGRPVDQEDIDVDKLSASSKYGGVVVKHGFVNRSSYRTRAKHVKWTEEATAKFYNNLAIYGLNFALLAALFPDRTRKQLKSKFKKEEKSNPERIKEALTNRLPMELNIEEFEKLVTDNLKEKEKLEDKDEDIIGDMVRKKTLSVKEKRELRRKQAAEEEDALASQNTEGSSSVTPNGTLTSTKAEGNLQIKEITRHNLRLKQEPLTDGEQPDGLLLGPPPGATDIQEAEIVLDDDDDDEDFEFDPFS